MKKSIQILFTFVSVLFLSLSAQGQVTTKSSFLIGGSMSFNTSDSKIELTQDGVTTTTNGPTTSIFNFEPVVGYFILPNFVVGGKVSYIREKVETKNETDKTDNLLLGPIVRYYLPFLDDKAALFVELDAAFGSSSDNNNFGGVVYSTDNSISKFGVGPGVTVFVNDLIGLEAIAKYNFVRGKANVDAPGISYDQTTTSNEFDFNIGLQFYFTRK